MTHKIRNHGAIFLATNTNDCPYFAKISSTKRSELVSTLVNDSVDSALLNLNQQFLDTHHHSAQLIMPDIEAILVYKGDELSLWKKNSDSYKQIACEIPTSDKRYTRLKQIAHIIVLITTIMDEYILNRVSLPEVITKLKNIINEVNLIRKGIELVFNDKDIKAQVTIIDETMKLLKILVSSQDSPLQWDTLKKGYVESLKPSIWYNNNTATEVQLNCLNNITKKWMKEHRIQLEKSRVIMVSPHGPRIGRIEAQYFIKLYQETLGLMKKDVEDNKVYHLEMLPSQFSKVNILEDLIKDFLLGSELNRAIGENILDSSTGMFSDILNQHAAPILESIFEHQTEQSMITRT